MHTEHENLDSNHIIRLTIIQRLYGKTFVRILTHNFSHHSLCGLLYEDTGD